MARQRFGGDWTDDKLGRVGDYLKAYSTALKNQRFTLEYIDAFAGTGYREAKDEQGTGETMFPGFAEPEVQGFLDGSARIALKTQPGFQRFTFIEKNRAKVKQLEKLRAEFPEKAIRIERGDANDWVQRICREDWGLRRAVLFLDPFGMQVEWQTLVSVAKTKAIDAWILFPLGVGVSRLLRRDGNLDETLCNKLDSVFGERSWREEFYRHDVPEPTVRQGSLFDRESDYPWRADFSTIERYFKARLRTIFAGVADNPVSLKNSKNVPLYLLFFVAGNEKGARIAVKMAQSIMNRP